MVPGVLGFLEVVFVFGDAAFEVDYFVLYLFSFGVDGVAGHCSIVGEIDGFAGVGKLEFGGNVPEIPLVFAEQIESKVIPAAYDIAVCAVVLLIGYYCDMKSYGGEVGDGLVAVFIFFFKECCFHYEY